MTEVQQERTSNRGIPRGAEATRNELLQLACTMICEEGFPPGINIRLADVVERAGRSLGSAYQIWDNQQLFREDVSRELSTLNEFIDTDLIAPLLVECVERGDDIEEIIEITAAQFFRLYVSTPSSFVTLHYWTVKPENLGGLQDSIAENYLLHERQWGELFEWVLASTGCEWCATDSKRIFTTLIIGLLQGLSLPYRFADTAVRQADLERAFVKGLKSLALEYSRVSPEPST